MAELLGAKPADVSDWIRKGWLPSTNGGSSPPRISEKGLIHFLKQRGVDIESIMAKAVVNEGQAQPDAPPEPAEDEIVVQAEPVEPDEQILQAVLLDARQRGASEVHFEPRRQGMGLRLRVDGVLHEKANFHLRLPPALAPPLVERLRALAGLEPTSSSPGQGRFSLRLDGQETGFGLSCLPVQFGQRLVVHLLPGQTASLADLVGAERTAALTRLLEQPSGLVVVSGPVKTGEPLLAAMAAQLAGPGRNVISLAGGEGGEGVTSAPPPRAGSAAAAEWLQAVAQQGPDVIVLPEVADAALADSAVSAAMRCLVLVGVPSRHAGTLPDPLMDAAGRHAVSAVLVAAVAQRVVRKLCNVCKRVVERPPELLEPLGLRPSEVDFPLFAGQGCRSCGNTGYVGSMYLLSVLPMTATMAALVRQGAPAERIGSQARALGYVPLRQDALNKLRAGLTTPEEVARIFA